MGNTRTLDTLKHSYTRGTVKHKQAELSRDKYTNYKPDRKIAKNYKNREKYSLSKYTLYTVKQPKEQMHLNICAKL